MNDILYFHSLAARFGCSIRENSEFRPIFGKKLALAKSHVFLYAIFHTVRCGFGLVGG